MNEVYGIGAIALALIALVGKIWGDFAKISSRMADVLEQNGVAASRLSLSIEANTRMTEETKEAAAEHNANITKLISKVVSSRR